MDFTTKDIALTSLMIAISVTLGFLFIAIPNVELISTSVFLSGFLLGKIRGALIGGIASFLYFSLTPYGSGLAYPFLLMTQVVVYIFIGFTGGIFNWISRPDNIKKRDIVLFSLAGLLLTLFYQTAASISYFFAARLDSEQLFTIIIAGIGASLLHIISNTVIFAVVIPLLAKKVSRLAIFHDD